MADNSYQDQLANIDSLDADGLDKLKKDVLAAFDTAESADDLDAMSAAADAIDQIVVAEAAIANAPSTEATNVGTEAVGTPADVADSADAGAAAVPVAASTVTADAGSASDDEEDDDDDAVTAAGMPEELRERFKAKQKGKKKLDNDNDEDDAVTAASTTEGGDGMPVEQIDLPAERQPIVASSTSTILAGADIPQRAAGSAYGSVREVSEAFVSRLETLRNVRSGDGEKCIVASVQSTVEQSRTLNPGADSDNFAKVDDVVRRMQSVDREALVASGGYCAPLDTRYDIFGIGDADRPVRDSLAGFQSTRGGIRYVQPPVLSSFSGAVGLWTAANDASPSAPATKPFMTVACQPEVTATADAVTLELQFGNLMTRAFPELVARNNELGLIYHARFAEQTLLTKITGLSTAVSTTWTLGTARDMLLAIGKAGAAYRTRHRLNLETPLRAILPAWVLYAMREDLARGYPGNDITWPDQQINAALDARNINITWHLDDPLFTGVQAAGALNDFPATIKWWIFAEGTFLFLDGGTLDLGIVRDSTLVGTNDYRMFVETFEGVAKVGVESLAVTTTTHVTGAIVGTVTPT